MAALPQFGPCLEQSELTADQLRHRLDQHASRLSRLKSPLELATVIQSLAPKIVVEKEKIQIHLTASRLSKLIAQPIDDSPLPALHPPFPVTVNIVADDLTISAAVELTCCRGRAEIIDGQTGKVATPRLTEPKTSLIQTLVQAEYWRTELLKNPAATLHDVLKGHQLQPGYVRRLLNAAYLAPAIKQAIFQGLQPPELQVQDLLKPRSLDWGIQLREMGFAPCATSASH